VNHHGHVHVVEVTETEKLGLAPEELELPCPRLLHAPGDVAVLLGGHREEYDAPGQVVEGLGAHQPHGRAQHARDLGIVTTGMGRARLRIGHGMPRDDEPVQLAQEGEGGPLALAPCLGAHAGDGQAALRREPDVAHGLFDQLRGLELLEAELRVLADRFADGDDLLALAVDGLADCALDVVECGHHVSFVMGRCGRCG